MKYLIPKILLRPRYYSLFLETCYKKIRPSFSGLLMNNWGHITSFILLGTFHLVHSTRDIFLGTFCRGHFAGDILLGTFCRGHFAAGTFCRGDILPRGHFAGDILPGTFCCGDILPTHQKSNSPYTPIAQG